LGLIFAIAIAIAIVSARKFRAIPRGFKRIQFATLKFARAEGNPISKFPVLSAFLPSPSYFHI